MNMENLNERAANYAAEKVNELLANAIAKAYADGYRDGYKDRDERIASSNSDSNLQFVDLGLPSGTKWSIGFIEGDGDCLYLPYANAAAMEIPTKEQVEELMNYCNLRENRSSGGQIFYGIYCLGNTSSEIYLSGRNYMIGDDLQYTWGVFHIYFWIRDDEDSDQKNAVRITGLKDGKPEMEIVKLFSGFKLPVMLVSND